LLSLALVAASIFALFILMKRKRGGGSSNPVLPFYNSPPHHPHFFHHYRASDLYFFLWWNARINHSTRRRNNWNRNWITVNPPQDPPPTPPDNYTTNSPMDDDRGKELNILEAIFSFVFGDSSPFSDTSFEEKRHKAIAGVIKENRGVVIAEQIAGYLDTWIFDYRKANKQGKKFTQEEYMLPVVSAFSGIIESSDDGFLLYHFPDLLFSASDHSSIMQAPPVTEEKKKFSSASEKQLTWAITLGILNLVGVVLVGLYVYPEEITGPIFYRVGYEDRVDWSILILTLFQTFFPFLLPYAIFYVTFPAVRYLVLKVLNHRIEKANKFRVEVVKKLLSKTFASDEIEEKLEAKNLFLGRLYA